MDIKENFYSKLQIIREEAEVKPNRNSKVVGTQKVAAQALKRLKKNDYEGAHAAVEGTPLRHLRTHLDNAQKHWTKMNELNNSSNEAKSEKHYNEIRNRANDHQDQAEHHHGKAVEYLEGHLPMSEEAEQLDELSDVTKAKYAMKAADQITDYVAKGTTYDMSPEGKSKTKGLMKRIGGLQRLDRMEKKKRKIRAIDKSRSKKRK